MGESLSPEVDDDSPLHVYLPASVLKSLPVSSASVVFTSTLMLQFSRMIGFASRP